MLEKLQQQIKKAGKSLSLMSKKDEVFDYLFYYVREVIKNIKLVNSEARHVLLRKLD